MTPPLGASQAAGLLRAGLLGGELLRIAAAAVTEHQVQDQNGDQDQASRLRELCAAARGDDATGGRAA
ncbi:MAG: hypothetical protein AAF108_04295 [Planctomycetota bacterium]